MIDLCLTAASLCGLAISSKLPPRLIPTVSFNIPKLGKLDVAFEASSLALLIALPILLCLSLSWSLLSLSSLMNLKISEMALALLLLNHVINRLTRHFLKKKDTHYPHSGPHFPQGAAEPWRGCWAPQPRLCRPCRPRGTQSSAGCCSWRASASTARCRGGRRTGGWEYSWKEKDVRTHKYIYNTNLCLTFQVSLRLWISSLNKHSYSELCSKKLIVKPCPQTLSPQAP